MAVARYFVHDVDESIAFYQNTLNFTVRQHGEGSPFAWTEKGDQSLWVSGPGTSAQQPMTNGSVPEPGGWNRIVVQVEDTILLHGGLHPQPTKAPTDLSEINKRARREIETHDRYRK